MFTCTLALALVLGACGPPPWPGGHVYKLYPGEVRPAEEFAVVDVGNPWLRIDGLKVSDWDYVELSPGEHTFEIWDLETYSYRVITLTLVAGHIYGLGSELERTRSYVWIEDQTTGDVIVGSKP